MLKEQAKGTISEKLKGQDQKAKGIKKAKGTKFKKLKGQDQKAKGTRLKKLKGQAKGTSIKS